MEVLTISKLGWREIVRARLLSRIGTYPGRRQESLRILKNVYTSLMIDKDYSGPDNIIIVYYMSHLSGKG